MSVDLYVLAKQAPAEITPSSIGLGTDVYPWPDAEKTDGWRYEGSRLELVVRPIEWVIDRFTTIEGIAPSDAASCIYYAPYWYMEGFEHTVAAAFGGVILAARLLAVNQSSGGGDLLLEVIAAAVIGGTSLFGGRGTVWGALFGALVIQSITNGINLLGYASSIRFMVTGAVLLLAVTVDAISRRSRAQAGLG